MVCEPRRDRLVVELLDEPEVQDLLVDRAAGRRTRRAGARRRRRASTRASGSSSDAIASGTSAHGSTDDAGAGARLVGGEVAHDAEQVPLGPLGVAQLRAGGQRAHDRGLGEVLGVGVVAENDRA